MKSKYRPEIDGLRAFAVVAVIINHFNKDLLPSGYLGVDIFFVISGFVITLSLWDRENKDMVDFMGRFYERRVKRLVPALVVFVLVTSILICLVNPDPGTALKTSMTSLFGVSNLYLFKLSADYFAQSTELNPFAHTWSLGVEEQFYLLFPFLIWFSGFGRQVKNGARNLILWIGALAVASLAGFITLYQSNQPAAYLLMPPRFWEMAFGCLLCIAVQKRTKIAQALEKVPPLLTVVVILGVMFLPTKDAVPATLSITVLSAVLIACLKQGTTAYNFFTLKKVVYVGLISYSLYLWHWVVLCISRWTVGIHWWSVPIQVGLMLAIAIASYNGIENPLRKREFANRATSFSSAFSCLAIVAASLWVTNRFFDGALYSGDHSYRNLLTGSRNYDHKSTYTGRHCHLRREANDLPRDCSIGGSTNKTIYFVGNSHSDHYRETHYLLNKEFGVSIDGISVSSCIFPPASSQAGCGLVQQKQQDRVLTALKKGDIVAISNRYNMIDTPEGWMQSKSSVRSLNDFAARVYDKGGKLLLFGPLPEFQIEAVRCMRLWFRPLPPLECEISTTSLQAARAASIQMEKLIDKRILVFYPMKPLCPNDTCRMIDDANKPLFADSYHLSDYANRQYIFPSFKNFLLSHQLL